MLAQALHWLGSASGHSTTESMKAWMSASSGLCATSSHCRRASAAHAHPAPRSGSAASPGPAGGQIAFVPATCPRFAHDVAAGAARFNVDGLEFPLHVGFQTDGQGMALHAPHCARAVGRGAGNQGRPDWPA
jgi:hypothetical protein